MDISVTEEVFDQYLHDYPEELDTKIEYKNSPNDVARLITWFRYGSIPTVGAVAWCRKDPVTNERFDFHILKEA